MNRQEWGDTSGVPVCGPRRPVLCAVMVLMCASPSATLRASEPDEARVVQGLYARTNDLRAKARLPPVAPQQRLENAARELALHMGRTARYGHEADGRTPAQRAEAHGYEYCIALENIAHQYSSEGYTTAALAERLARGWELSPPHRKNLLDPHVTDTGAAIARSAKDGRYYAVQMFGLPASRMTEFRITNESPGTVRYRIDGRSQSLAPRATGTHSRCRPGRVTFQWPDGQQATHIEPAAGEHYVVTRSGSGAWTVTRGP